MTVWVIYLLLCVIAGLLFLLVYRPSPKEASDDSEALSLPGTEAVPPTPSPIEPARDSAA